MHEVIWSNPSLDINQSLMIDSPNNTKKSGGGHTVNSRFGLTQARFSLFITFMKIHELQICKFENSGFLISSTPYSYKYFMFF